MSGDRADNVLIETYSDRFGEPLTDDEVYGYWLFLASVVVAAIGILVFLSTDTAGTTRMIAFVLSALGLTGALTGLVVGQSFNRLAKLLVYLGVLLCLVAIAWFVTVYPDGWTLGDATTTNIILLYTAGVAIVGIAGAMAPVVVGQSRAREAAEEALVEAREEIEEQDEEIEDQSEEVADLRERLEGREERIEELEDELEDAREEREAERGRADAAEARLDRLHDSNATFQLYEDRSDQWRWRLVHRNGNIVATSGEGYASDRNARRGMRSVTRNALGADVFWDREEAEPEPEPEPVAEESRATFELFVDRGGEDRWRLRHRNGTILATGGEGYSDRSGAIDGVNSVKRNAPGAEVIEEEEEA